MIPAHKDTKNPPGQIVDNYYIDLYKTAEIISDIVEQSNNQRPISDYKRGFWEGYDKGYKSGVEYGKYSVS